MNVASGLNGERWRSPSRMASLRRNSMTGEAIRRPLSRHGMSPKRRSTTDYRRGPTERAIRIGVRPSVELPDMHQEPCMELRLRLLATPRTCLTNSQRPDGMLADAGPTGTDELPKIRADTPANDSALRNVSARSQANLGVCSRRCETIASEAIQCVDETLTCRTNSG